jgi:hypothetical protein
MPYSTTRCQFYIDVKSGSRSGSPRRRAPDYRISINPWRRKEYPAAAAHQTMRNQITGWRARNRDLPDIGRVGSPPKPHVPQLTTVQRGEVRVLDEPSMVGLMVWVELRSWRPWFGRSIIMVKARGVKIRVESGSSWKLLILSMLWRPTQWCFGPSEFPWMVPYSALCRSAVPRVICITFPTYKGGSNYK